MARFEANLEHEMLRYRNDLAALEHEKALLEITRREVERARDLAERGVGSEASLDQARRDEERQILAVEQRKLAIREHDSRRKQIEAQLAQARAQRSRAMLDLDRTQVYPPFDGRITEVFVSPGDRVRPGDRLLTLYDTETVELRAQIRCDACRWCAPHWSAARACPRGRWWTAERSVPYCIGSPPSSTADREAPMLCFGSPRATRGCRSAARWRSSSTCRRYATRSRCPEERSTVRTGCS